MKKIHLALVIIAGVTLAGLSACRFNCVHGSSHIVSEDRKVGDFSKISVSENYKVVLKQDSSMAVKVTADDNLLKYIKTETEGSKLHIFSKRSLCNNGQLVINIGVKNLDEIKASGAVEIESDGTIHTQDLHLNLSGATKITMALNAAM